MGGHRGCPASLPIQFSDNITDLRRQAGNAKPDTRATDIAVSRVPVLSPGNER